jgi:hypothetical protein
MSVYTPISTARDRERFAARRVAADRHDRVEILPCDLCAHERGAVGIPSWPAALNWRQALTYTGLGPAYLRKLTEQGRLVFRQIGPRGSKIVLRAELDRILTEILSAEMKSTGIEEDFDFG